MPASVSLPSLANGVVPVSGTGHSGTVAILAVAFTASNGRRRSLEMYVVPVTAGSISANVPVPITGGTVTVKVADPSTAAVAATSSGLGV